MDQLLSIRSLIPVIAFSALLQSAAHAQSPAPSSSSDCILGSAKQSVESGNIKAMMLNGGDMFWDLTNQKFEVPKGSGKHSIFAGAAWFGGVDPNPGSPWSGGLHVATQTYRQAIGGPADKGYWPGPISQNGMTNANDCALFDFIAKVSAKSIDSLRARAMLGIPIPDSEIPYTVKIWPGKGNPFRANISNMGTGQLAPFVDVNNDGIYDPRMGDYPNILGDEAAFTIMNDVGGVKEPLTPAIGMETHVMMYGFGSQWSNDVQNTIFVRYTLINRGNKTLTNCYFGKWVDLDIGNYLDDMVGCDVSRNMYYAYNGDNDDEGPKGYGINPPAQGVVFLNRPMTNFIYFENNNSPINGNPNEATDYYNYMQSRWRMGSPVVYGGNGITGTTPAAHMYDGDPVNGTGWIETTLGDRRGMGATGPFTFAPGSVQVIDMAYPWARGLSNLNSITQLRQTADNVQAFYNNLTAVPNANNHQAALNQQVYPNPTEGSVQVQLSAAVSAEATFTLRDLTGRTVQLESTFVPAGQGNHQLELQKVPAGLYLLQVQQGSSSQIVKVIKQ